jgi:hypothetical protein
VRVKGFKKCCIAYEMDAREDEEVGKVGSEYKIEDGNCDDNAAETDN